MKYSFWRCVRRAFLLPALQIAAVSTWSAAVVPARAVAAEAEAPSKPADQIVVTGVVVDAAGKPVAEARGVVQTWPVETEITTDERGRFQFSAPVAQLRGRSIVVRASGGELIGRQALPYEAEKFVKLQPLRIELKPTVLVRLRVTDDVGQPVADALCGLMADSEWYGRGATDKDGRAQFRIPADAQLHNVYAVKSGLGLDYRAFYDPAKYRAKQPLIAPSLDEPFELKLEGAHTVRIKIVEEQTEDPIAAASVNLWLTKKPGEVDDLNLSYYSKQLGAKTDDGGWVVFDWLPYWEERTGLTFWASHPGYGRVRGNYDLDKGIGVLTIKLPKLIALSGQVRFPDGSAAAGIPVRAVGENYGFDSFREETITDSEGRYTFKAIPNMLYLVVAGNRHWAAFKDSFSLSSGQPQENADLVLQPATRIHGRVTAGVKQQPVRGYTITSYQYGKSLHEMQDVKLPNPEGSRQSVTPLTFHRAVTNEQGEYEFFVGPGSFDIRGPTNTKVQKFAVTDQKELEFNFHSDHAEKGELKGVVVDAKTGGPAGNASVQGIHRNMLAGHDLDIKAGGDGTFKVERELHATVLYARSEDGASAGVVEIGPAVQHVKVEIRPVASATGILIDKQTKQPLAGKEIQFGIEVPLGDDDAPWRTAFGGSVMTDGEGKFVLEKLVQGKEYSISVVGEDGHDFVPVGKVTAKDAEVIDLGKLEYSPAPLRR